MNPSIWTRIIPLLVLSVVLFGCVFNSDGTTSIVGKDEFKTSTWVPFGGPAGAEAQAASLSQTYCAIRGKKWKLITIKSGKCLLRGGCGEATVTYSCLNKEQELGPGSQIAERVEPSRQLGSTGSGFFVSKLGHVVTNQHVVNNCKSVTVGDNANNQVSAFILESDKRNDLALLRISNMNTASAETKTLVAKLGLAVTPLASQGLFRSDSIELGEDVVVAGFPFGDIFSNTVKITKGIISAKRGIGDNTGQFQIDAAVQHGNSGGPIYDENGNIIGVVVAQLNKLKVAKAIGSLPENVNFGIKASTVRQFLTSSGLPTKWSKRSKRMSTKDIARIAENQTVMVVCHR